MASGGNQLLLERDAAVFRRLGERPALASA